MLNIDFWYGNEYKDITGVSVSFYPNDGEYRGNVYQGSKIIGDFTATDRVEIETSFPGIFD